MKMLVALLFLGLTMPALADARDPRRGPGGRQVERLRDRDRPRDRPIIRDRVPLRRGDGVQAWREVRQGRGAPIRDIERRVIPMMRGSQYLGFDYDAPGAIYTLKFLRNGTVIWVDVDGRSGRVVGRTGR